MERKHSYWIWIWDIETTISAEQEKKTLEQPYPVFRQQIRKTWKTLL